MARALGYEQLTALGTVKSLAGVPSAARAYSAKLQAEAQAVRYRDDGQNPTAAIGFIIPANSSIDYEGDFAALRFIEVTSGAKLNVLYYGM